MRNGRPRANLTRGFCWPDERRCEYCQKKAPAVETPIAENEYVKELLALLKENQSPAGKELLEAIGHVSEMEKQLASAVDELKAMRQDLEKMKNSPLKSALQNQSLSCKTVFLPCVTVSQS